MAPVVATAALVVLVVALADSSVWPKGPLFVAAALLGLGFLVAAAIRRSAGGPAAEPTMLVAVVATGAVLLWSLSTLPYGAPRWPALAGIAVLGGGLVLLLSEDMTRDLAAPEAARLIPAVAALIVVVAALVDASSVWPQWPLWISAAALAAGIAAGPIARRAAAPSIEGPALTVATVLTLVVTVVTASVAHGATPRWPELVAATILGCGLVASGLIARFAGGPRERVLSARVDQLSRTRSGALDVQATELRRIERDLHDGAQARLVALSMKLGRAEDRFGDDAPVAELLREAREDAAAAIRELRELARGIAPPVLADRGLEAAVRSLAQRSGSEVTVSGDLSQRAMPAVELAAYFVVAESLTNAAKHAPGARVEIRLDERGGDLFVEVTDFGPGNADPSGGGLAGLRQRVEALDGSLHVTSPAGVGTQVEAALPCRR